MRKAKIPIPAACEALPNGRTCRGYGIFAEIFQISAMHFCNIMDLNLNLNSYHAASNGEFKFKYKDTKAEKHEIFMDFFVLLYFRDFVIKDLFLFKFVPLAISVDLEDNR